jgi:hypothetical protein
MAQRVGGWTRRPFLSKDTISRLDNEIISQTKSIGAPHSEAFESVPTSHNIHASG